MQTLSCDTADSGGPGARVDGQQVLTGSSEQWLVVAHSASVAKLEAREAKLILDLITLEGHVALTFAVLTAEAFIGSGTLEATVTAGVRGSGGKLVGGFALAGTATSSFQYLLCVQLLQLTDDVIFQKSNQILEVTVVGAKFGSKLCLLRLGQLVERQREQIRFDVVVAIGPRLFVRSSHKNGQLLQADSDPWTGDWRQFVELVRHTSAKGILADETADRIGL